MKTQSTDTQLKTEKILIALIKRQSPAQKFSQIRSLSQLTIQLSKRAIARANKDLDENQLNLLFINFHYGQDLAGRVRKYLNLDKHENT